MNFSYELNNYINLLNCSPKEFSEISGLSPTIISRYLNGKRTPRIQSQYFNQIVNSIYEISKQKNIELELEDITNTLRNSITFSDKNFDIFVENFNTLLNEFKINIADIANSIGYDTSFISRIKNKTRKPSDLNSFIDSISTFFVNTLQTDTEKKQMSTLLNCTSEALNNKANYKKLLIKWITSSQENNRKAIENFLKTLNNFDLNDYITNNDYEKIKIPTSPVILRTSKVFYGVDGRKQSEAEFLKTTLISKSKDPIFFYNDLPMEEASHDEDFKQKWVLAITLILKKGLHLNIIHNVDRPINEMLVGLENWIPIYMTGSISPYYFTNPPSDMFATSHCTSGSVALSGECNPENPENSRFYVTTKKEDLKYYSEKSKYMLSKAKPLITIFKDSDSNEFLDFMNNYKNAELQQIENDLFKNIDFVVNKNKWIMINKKLAPEIHFVIYNHKLRNAIETFLNR